MLAKLQLSAVGVRFPESSMDPPPPLWKSPKSPKLSKDVSSTSSSESDDGKVNGSEPLAAAASEKGPKASYEIGVSIRMSWHRNGTYVVERIREGTGTRR